jgi:hypothetical protein
VWVGPDSPIPNTRGFRNDVVGALKRQGVPANRWPGGCFADEYHRRDGIGSQVARPVRIDTHGGGVTEPDTVGSHEFMDVAGQIGAGAYVSGNIGSGTPRARWRRNVRAMAARRRGTSRRSSSDASFEAVAAHARRSCRGFGAVLRHVMKAPADRRIVRIAAGANVAATDGTEAHRGWARRCAVVALQHRARRVAAAGDDPGRWGEDGADPDLSRLRDARHGDAEGVRRRHAARRHLSIALPARPVMMLDLRQRAASEPPARARPVAA